MTEVLPRDILLRVGGRTLHRTGFLAAMGAGRGYVEVKETFGRADGVTPVATFIDRDLSIRTAAADKLRIEYPPALAGLLDFAGLPYCGPLLEGPGANRWQFSDDQTNAAWLSNGLTSVIGGDPDPDGGNTACHTVENVANTSHIVGQNFPAATDNTRQSVTWHAAKKERTWAVIRSFPKDGVAKFSYVNLATGAKGTIDASHDISVSGLLKNGFYRITMSFDAKAGGSTPSAWIGGATGDLGIIFVGDGASGIYVWRGQFEKDVAIASSPIKTPGAGVVTRAADNLTVPVFWGPMDCTILTRIYRPVWADAGAAVDLLLPPTAFQLGDNATPNIRGGGVQAARSWYGYIDTAGADSNQTAAIPAGLEQVTLRQYKNLAAAAGGQVALDVGAGLGGFAAAATQFFTFGNQIMAIGRGTVGQELYGVILDHIVARGLRTLGEMLAIK